MYTTIVLKEMHMGMWGRARVGEGSRQARPVHIHCLRFLVAAIPTTTVISFLWLLQKVTPNRQLRTTEMFSLTVPVARSPKPRCQQSWFFLQKKSSGYEGELVPWISPGLWCFAWNFWRALVCVRVSPGFTWHFPCVFVSVSKFPLFYKDTVILD